MEDLFGSRLPGSGNIREMITKSKKLRLSFIVALCLIIMNGCGNTGQDNLMGKTKEPVTEAAGSGAEKDRDTDKRSGRKDKDKKKKDNSETAPDTEEPEKEEQEEREPEKKKPEKNWKGHEEVFAEYDGIYRKLNRGEDVNILINGDSIGAGGGSTEGNSWTDLLKDHIESEYGVSCNMTNISLGGNGSYAGYVMENILDDSSDYDLMIICYGENDDRKNLSLEYEAMIRSAERKYPSCNLISILESSQREYTKKIEIIEELSEYYDIPAADTIRAFNDSGREYEELTVDVKHPNDEGYKLYFNEVKKIIDEEVTNDTGVEVIERIPLNPEVSEFDTFSWFPAERFIRTDERTWTLTPDKEVRGIIGLYHLFCPSDGEIVIQTDGREALRRPMVWSYDFSQDFIYWHDKTVRSASSRIDISFPTSEMADGFKGLIFTGP